MQQTFIELGSVLIVCGKSINSGYVNMKIAGPIGGLLILIGALF